MTTDGPPRDGLPGRRIACGIEIAGKKAIFVFLASVSGSVEEVEAPSRFLRIGDDDDPSALWAFHRNAAALLDTVNPQRVGILERKKAGSFSAGGTTFKLEALIQLNPKRDIPIVPLRELRTFVKTGKPGGTPRFRYQKNAYLLARFLLDEAGQDA